MTPPPAEPVAAMIRPAPVRADSKINRDLLRVMEGASLGYWSLLHLRRVLHARGGRRVDLPGLQGPRHRGLQAPGVLGRLHRHVRVLGRHRARRHADLGDPLPVPREVAQRDQPQRRGDDGVRGAHRGAVPRHPRRPDLEVLLHPAVPEPARAVGELQEPAALGHVRDHDLRDDVDPVPLRRPDPRPRDRARPLDRLAQRALHGRSRSAGRARRGSGSRTTARCCTSRASRHRSCSRCTASCPGTSRWRSCPAGTPRSSRPTSWPARSSRASRWCSR